MFRKIILSSIFFTAICPAHADQIKFPKMKAGDWESTVTMKGLNIPGMAGPKKMIYCLGEKEQEEMVMQFNDFNQPGCEKPVMSQSGNRYLVTLNCNIQGMQMKLKSEANIISDTEVRGTAKMDSGMGVSMDSDYSSKYKGPCAEGRKPGDMKEVG